MDKNTASIRKTVIDKSMAGRKMLLQVRSGAIQLRNPLVGVFLGVLGVQTGSNCKNVGDSIATQYVLVVGGNMVA